jgi:predicted PolB exonuclease-like 3'-5' exonuclease
MSPLNNAGALRFIVDIETFPLGNCGDYLDLTQFSAPSNWKDPEKIAANIEEQKAAAIAKAALDLDLCTIVAIGWMREDWNKPSVSVCVDHIQESAALRHFWDELDNRVTIGYNHVGFDLPILLRRSLYLGVHAPALNLDKYRTPHIDLQQRLSLNGTKPYRSLNWYAKRFGLDVPADANTGKDIGQLVSEGKWEDVAAHCRADVIKTRLLAERMGVLQARVEQPEMVL